MRVKMKESMPVTVDGVNTLDLENGETYEVGDAVGADLIAADKAEGAEDTAASPSRRSRGKRGKTAPAEEDGEKADESESADKAEGAAEENKSE